MKDSRSASQEIFRLLWNPNIHFCVHKSPSSSGHCVTFRNVLVILRWADVTLQPNPQAEVPPPVCYSKLLIQYLHS